LYNDISLYGFVSEIFSPKFADRQNDRQTQKIIRVATGELANQQTNTLKIRRRILGKGWRGWGREWVTYRRGPRRPIVQWGLESRRGRQKVLEGYDRQTHTLPHDPSII